MPPPIKNPNRSFFSALLRKAQKKKVGTAMTEKGYDNTPTPEKKPLKNHYFH